MIQSPVFWGVVLLSVVGYWLLPRRSRSLFLIAVSVLYVGSIDAFSVALLAAWAVVFFVITSRFEQWGRHSRWVLLGLILAVLAVLAFFKFGPLLNSLLGDSALDGRIIVPLGISYFTFKLIHFAVEVGRGAIRDFTFQDFVCYLFLFPIFTAGPIERFDHFLAQRDESFQLESFVWGMTRIVHGLIKRFVFCELILRQLQLVSLTSFRDVVDRLTDLSPAEAWTFVLLTALYAYLDFSAYCDIAIGCSRLYGIRIMENFNFPFLSKNLGEFWTRWHMTLSGWCQSYVYMPLIGLTRNPYIAIYATFLTMGLWHAGTWHWVLWGLYHATGVAIFATWNRIRRRRKWTWPDRWPVRWLATPMTLIYFSGSAVFASGYSAGAPVYESLRLLAKLLLIDLP